MKIRVKKLIVLVGMLFFSNSTVSAMDSFIFKKDPTEPIIRITTDSINISSYVKSFFSSPMRTVLTVATIYGYCWVSRAIQFNKVDQWLINSSTLTEPYNSFSNWKVNNYKSTADLLGDIYKTRADLYENVQDPDNYFFKDKNNCPINYQTATKIYKLDNIQNLILQEVPKEKRYLKNRLNYLAHFTSFALILQKYANRLFGRPKTQNHSPNNELLHHCEKILKDRNLENLNKFEALIENSNRWLHAKSNVESYFLYRAPILPKHLKARPIVNKKEKEKESNDDNGQPILYQKRSLNPWNWRICNSNKADELYYEMLKRYLWLLSLEMIVKEEFSELLQ